MDLAAGYRALVRKHFPQARIVADRFHVIRAVNHQPLQVPAHPPSIVPDQFATLKAVQVGLNTHNLADLAEVKDFAASDPHTVFTIDYVRG